jgi:hypothetical protein
MPPRSGSRGIEARVSVLKTVERFEDSALEFLRGRFQGGSVRYGELREILIAVRSSEVGFAEAMSAAQASLLSFGLNMGDELPDG